MSTAVNTTANEGFTLTKVFGYARVSTCGQDNAVQVKALTEYGCTDIRQEKISGTREDRPELQGILRELRQGDKVVVWSMDRLARNMKHLLQIIEDIENAGASLEIITQSVDTGSISGRLMLQVLGMVAEFETNIRAERQRAGIEKKKADGKPFHDSRRSKQTDYAAIVRLTNEGKSQKQIAESLGVSVSTVKRARREAKQAAQQ